MRRPTRSRKLSDGGEKQSAHSNGWSGRPLIVIHGGPDFDHTYLLPQLESVRVPTLVIHGDLDFFPVESSAHIAQAIPGARLAVLRDSGHFSYIDASEQLREAVVGFL